MISLDIQIFSPCTPTINKRTQYAGNDILMLGHHDLDGPFFACDQLTQGVAVNVQKAAEQSGGIGLECLFDAAIESFRAVIGK